MEKKKIAQAMSEKLEYICLDLEQIPETLKYVENINFKPNIGIEENKYRQYRFVSPKELEILLSPCNRLEDTKTKYSKAKPLVSYLEPKTEEEKELHKEFLRMLEEVDIDEIKQIEEQQQLLNKKIPFKVRYPKNYLWQIYYSEIDDKYFMIVTTEDQDYSTFFYVLKKQLEKKKAGKIFVPINNIDYSKEILNKTEIESLENYLWTFTNDWPSIYEVYDKTGKISLQIVGQTQVLGNIKSEYKVKLTSKIDASKFFKLVKALYIVQTEVPEYYKFEVQIDKQGEIEFQYQNQILKYDELTEFVNEQYKKLIDIEDENIKNEWRLSHNNCIDPTNPEALNYIKEDIKRICNWGYTLIKHDFSTFDLFGKWGFQMSPLVTDDGWHFYDDSLTSAEVVKLLYKAILDASVEASNGEALILGCNTIGHLGAGYMHINRTGDDTSGVIWERTRFMGVNTLAFRLPQHGKFYEIDADCVGIDGGISWSMNKQWADVLAQSGTPLFISVRPNILDETEKQELHEILKVASKQEHHVIPVDWEETTCPEHWQDKDHDIDCKYQWFEETGLKFNPNSIRYQTFLAMVE